MDPTIAIVTITSVSTELSLLNNLLAIFSILLFLLFSAFIIFILFAMSMLKREKSYTQSQAQQPQQQDSNIQQSNKNGTFVDYKTLKFIKISIALSISLIILIIIISLLAPISSMDTLGYQVILVMILLIAVTSILPLYDGYIRVKELLPKRIRRIVKKTIIYEDGTTEEIEREY